MRANIDDSAGKHFSCALTAVLLARVRQTSGDGSVTGVLEGAGCRRGVDYLEDIGNWVSQEEMVDLWRSAAEVTGDEQFARHAGEDAVRQLGSSATSVVLRGLGSPEELLRRVGVASRRFTTVATLEPVEVQAGFGEIHARADPGFARHPLHCLWTQGMLSQATVLFGLPPAAVEHTTCQARGAPECRYLVRWEPEAALEEGREGGEAPSLKRQLEAMSERLRSVFATAADLIASGDLDETLARITERAALQVRAPRYLLAVRPTPSAPIHCHQKGLSGAEARAIAERVLSAEPSSLPDHWLSVEVRSHANHYGSLVAMYDEGAEFLPQERELLDVYARYAATALDSAAALAEARRQQREAQRRYEESHALLELARRLATAESSEAVAARLAEAVPSVVDCDRVSVYLWEEESGEFVRQAVAGPRPGDDGGAVSRLRPDAVPRLQTLLDQPSPEPISVDLDETAPGRMLRQLGVVATVTVPIATEERLLGCLVVSVMEDPDRLALGRELRDRLSGVAAHAVTALENGRLVDRITHQARHDHLTDLLNRLGFREALATANERAREEGERLGLFFLDLDNFKAVNDEFGHEVGDSLLGAVGRRLASRMRPSEIAGRLGGDEFAVIVERLGGEDEIGGVKVRLREAFATPFQIGGRTFSIGASVGAAIWPLDVDDPEELLRSADAAMYEVKRKRGAAKAQVAAEGEGGALP